MKHQRHKSSPPPLDSDTLQRLAIAYVGRYATTRAKLQHYLQRKIRERGWADSGEPTVADLVERVARLGFVDDQVFALAKSASFTRRGFGERRLQQALRAAGIAEDDGATATAVARETAWAAARRFAERKGIGPFAATRADPDKRRKQLGMMLRAGHPAQLAQIFVRSDPGEIPEEDIL